SPGLPTLRMEYLSPLHNSPHRSTWPVLEQKNRPSVYIFLSPPRSPRFSPTLFLLASLSLETFGGP
ncbi:hypothetical protein M9458_004401, partial [Cirrhinus mrigala]